MRKETAELISLILTLRCSICDFFSRSRRADIYMCIHFGKEEEEGEENEVEKHTYTERKRKQ